MTTLLPAEPLGGAGDRPLLELLLQPLVEPLPMPAPGWGVVEAVCAWEAARDLLPVEVTGVLAPDEPVVPVSALTTVVLRIGPWAVKVYPPGTDVRHVAGVGEALAGSRTAHLPVCGPVESVFGVVTVSGWLRLARPVTWAETGRLLRAFHAEHTAAPLPRWQPLSRLETQVAALPPALADVLRAAKATLVEALADTTSDLGEGPIHGDVSPANVMRTQTGPRLIDLDWAALGPQEYDLAAAARRLRTGEISSATYRRFCSAYGHDVRSWAGLPVVDRIASLGGVVFRLWDCRHHGWSTEWLEEEVRGWRQPL